MKDVPARRVALGLAFATAAVIVSSVNDANTQTSGPAPLEVPARTIPVPATVSPEMQTLVGAPRAGNWNVAPTAVEEWRKLSSPSAGRGLPALRQRFRVTSESIDVNGVKAFVVTPEHIPAANRDRLLVHMHGGCYVLNGGEAGTTEAIYMAGFGGFKVLSVDYRRPPDFPYPAALDDGMAVW